MAAVVDNFENSQRKNNGKRRELKEGIERDDLSGFLGELFTSWVGLDGL